MKKMSMPPDQKRKKFLAFFFVPRCAFLKEQCEKLKQATHLRVALCDESHEVVNDANGHDVIVCTPQKLLK